MAKNIVAVALHVVTQGIMQEPRPGQVIGLRQDANAPNADLKPDSLMRFYLQCHRVAAWTDKTEVLLWRDPPTQGCKLREEAVTRVAVGVWYVTR